MNGIEWLPELLLAGLLGVTLLHAIRLTRALGALHRDRAAVGKATSGSARQAEAGQPVARRAALDDLPRASARLGWSAPFPAGCGR